MIMEYEESGTINGIMIGGELTCLSKLTSAQEKKLSGLSAFSKLVSASGDENPLHHLTAAEIRKREETVRATAHYFCERTGKCRSADDAFLALATGIMIPNRLLEEFTASYDILLAGALWLLDYVDKRGLMQKLMDFLPESAEVVIEDDAQVFKDVMYDRDLVLRVFQVIKGRKKAYKEAFRSIIGLIRKSDAENLRAAFKSTILDYFDRFCEIRARLESTDYSEWMEQTHEYEKAFATENAELSAFHMHVGSYLQNDFCENPPIDIVFLLNTAALYCSSDETKRLVLRNKRAIELLSGFRVQDPFEIFAAYLLLESEGDYLCRMGMLTATVLTTAGFLLPWTREYNRSIGVNQFEFALSRFIPVYSFKPCGEGFASLSKGAKLTEEQLFCLSTGYVLPRGRTVSRDLIAWLEKQGVPHGRARELACIAMTLACCEERKHREEGTALVETAAEESDAEPEEDPKEPEAESVELLRDRIAGMNRMMKTMRIALHEAETKVKTAQDRLQEAEKRTEKDRMELANLRESLFSLMSGNEGEHSPETEDDIVFPYTLTLRTLAFGGVDAWRNGMQSLVRGARFYDRDTLRNPNMLKQADVVWLQTNAMPHSLFYHILDIARRENLTVRYFSSSSARNCAEQMVREEMLLLRDRE